MESKYLDSGWIPGHGIPKILGLRKTEAFSRKTEKVREKGGAMKSGIGVSMMSHGRESACSDLEDIPTESYCASSHRVGGGGQLNEQTSKPKQ